MGPAKGSRTITKITIKGYDDRQHDEDPTSSSKVKLKKRKMSDLGPQWSKDELMRFYEAYRRHGKKWKKVSASVGGKSADAVEALYSVHRTFLSLPEREGTAMGFVALVTGHHNVSDESKSLKESDQMVSASGKRRKRGEATGQKGKELPHAHCSYHERRTYGLSSFKKRYYGDLVKNIPRHPSAKRTPRVPVIVPADMNVADAARPEIENAINYTKKASEAINNELGRSPDGSSGISETAKVVEDQIFLETKGTRDTQILGGLEKRRIEQSMDHDQTIKDEHDTTKVAKEGNDLTDYQNLTRIFSPDEMLVLDVLESLVTVPGKISEPKINIPSSTLEKNDSTFSHRREEGPCSVKRSKQGKQVGECSASKTRNKRRKKLIAEAVPTEEPNISNRLNLPEERQVDTTEHALNSDPERGTLDLPESTANISTEVPDLSSQMKPEINMSRRKRKSKRQCGSMYGICNGEDDLQARRLQHCLSSESLRRWCTYEWFYSAVDYPWFMDNEFVNYLNFANFSHLSRLTRSEWSTIRSSLGRPRRFSDHFLVAEKEKLEDYRKKVRQYYAQRSEDSQGSLPSDLARPFSIGQQVIVRHPRTRELSNGKVVMMEHDGYKVQFDRPDLSVDKVKDTDCMPVNWLDNLPDDLKKKSFLSNNSHDRAGVEQIPKLTSKENWDHINGQPKPSKTVNIPSDEHVKVEIAADTERLSNKSASGNCGPLQLLQSVDDIVRSRDWLKHSNGHNDELDSSITSCVQESLLQAKQMVDKVMQTISGNAKNSLEETGISNEATDCKNPELEFDADSEIPGDLILNCIATVLAIKHLSDSEYRQQPAKIAGVLERACLMLRPSCSENLPIYNDIENCISVIKNQILALVPTASSSARLPMYM